MRSIVQLAVLWIMAAGRFCRLCGCLAPGATCGATFSVTGAVAHFYVFANMPLGLATVTLVLFTTAMTGTFLGERVGRRRWSATAVGFGGVLLVIRAGSVFSSNSRDGRPVRVHHGVPIHRFSGLAPVFYTRIVVSDLVGCFTRPLTCSPFSARSSSPRVPSTSRCMRECERRVLGTRPDGQFLREESAFLTDIATSPICPSSRCGPIGNPSRRSVECSATGNDPLSQPRCA